MQSSPLEIAASHGQTRNAFRQPFTSRNSTAAAAARPLLFAAPVRRNRIAQIARVRCVDAKKGALHVFHRSDGGFVREHVADRDQPIQRIEKLGRLHFPDAFHYLFSGSGRARESHRFQKRDLAAAQINLAPHNPFFAANRTLSSGLSRETPLRILLQPIPKSFQPLAHFHFDFFKLCHLEFSFRRQLLREKVELDLWFGS